MAVRRKTGPVGLAPVAPRHWFFRASMLMLLTVSAALIVMSRSGNPAAQRLRESLMDASAPVLAAAASPMNAVAGVGEWFGELARLRAENIALKNENRELLQWQSAAKAMEAENASLKELMHVVASRKSNYITARIVSDLGGPYVHSALLAGGAEQGIRKDQPVINERGLIGRVIETGKTSARVLLLSDMNSRVPVMMESSREKGILSGSSDGAPRLTYLPADTHIEAGERIVTSGDGGVFPQGIAVGIVESVEKNGIRVQLFADPGRAEFVSVVDYAL